MLDSPREYNRNCVEGALDHDCTEEAHQDVNVHGEDEHSRRHLVTTEREAALLPLSYQEHEQDEELRQPGSHIEPRDLVMH